jgi:hypothetical protein
MQSKIFTSRFIYVTVAILVAAISRILPHPANFTPIAAMALFGGAYMTDKKFAFIIPLLAMFISDCILQIITGYGFHNTMIFVYGSFAATVALGFLLRNNNKAGRIVILSLLSSCIFFVITNFATWWLEGTNGVPLYPHTVEGLISCFAAGIPFFRNEMFGDLFFCGILFGSFFFAKSKFPALA